MSEVIYCGQIHRGVWTLERNGQPLGFRFGEEHDLMLTRVVRWGEPERRLHFAAYMLAADLFTAAHAEYAVPRIHSLLNTFPADQEWQITRAELLERAFFKRTVEVNVQGRHVQLSLLGVPEDESFLRVLIDTPHGWLEIYGPELDPEYIKDEDGEPGPVLDATTYLSLTPFPPPEVRQEGPWINPRGLLALQSIADEHGLVVEEESLKISFEADKTPAFRAFVVEAVASLGLGGALNGGDKLTYGDSTFLSGEPVALADAVVFGRDARADLVELTLEFQRVESRPFWLVERLRPQFAVDRARLPYRAALEASSQVIFAGFLQSSEPRVRQQLAQGRYRVGGHILSIGAEEKCSVMTVDEYTKWRERRLYGDVRHEADWLNAPEPQALPERVNPVEDDPRPSTPGWLDLSLF
jgi:hypothetical protein